MDRSADDTRGLLRRWHDNDTEALSILLERDREWLQRQVSRRLGRRLREFGDTNDYVGEVTLRALKWTPRFVVADRTHFRSILLRIAENTLRDEAEKARAKMRSLRREIPLDNETVLDLDNSDSGVSSPIVSKERRAWLLLALDVADVTDRDVILLRVWRGASYQLIGKELGVSPDAARMRFQRALAKLKSILEDLRGGRVDSALDTGAVLEGGQHDD